MELAGPAIRENFLGVNYLTRFGRFLNDAAVFQDEGR
jgi:hypothetical protein